MGKSPLFFNRMLIFLVYRWYTLIFPLVPLLYTGIKIWQEKEDVNTAGLKQELAENGGNVDELT